MYLNFVQAGVGSQLPDPVEQLLAGLDGEGGEHTFPAQHPTALKIEVLLRLFSITGTCYMIVFSRCAILPVLRN
jgi:hypothetical protein